MNNLNRLWTLVPFALALGLTLPVQAQQKNARKTLIYCSEGSPETFSPGQGTSGVSHDAMSPIYGRLVLHMRGSTRLLPSLAQHWQVSPDSKEFTFFLQKGVRWHSNEHFTPTREFNADDVVFMFERQWKTDHPYHAVGGAQYSFFKSTGLEKLISQVEKIDDHTVKVTLNQSTPTFLYILSLGFAGIQSQEYAAAMLAQGRPEIIDQHPVGTGPFYWVNYEKDTQISYRTFTDYWEGRSKLEGLEFLIVPDAQERWAKIQNQQCHVMGFPKTEDWPAIRKHPDVRVIDLPGVNVAYLSYNLNKPPFDDVRVRKALNMVVNKRAIVERVYEGLAVPAVSLIPPTMWSYNSKLKDEPYNPKAAKKLLAEAGLANGFTTDLWVMPVARPYMPNANLMAELIREDWAKIGVHVTFKTAPWGDYLKRVYAGEHQTALLGWTGSHGDPDYFFYNLLSCDTAVPGGANISKFCNRDYDALVLKARQLANPALRMPLYEEAQRIFKEQAPWLTMAHSVQSVIHRKEVVNLRVSPFGGRNFYGVELK